MIAMTLSEFRSKLARVRARAVKFGGCIDIMERTDGRACFIGHALRAAAGECLSTEQLIYKCPLLKSDTLDIILLGQQAKQILDDAVAQLTPHHRAAWDRRMESWGPTFAAINDLIFFSAVNPPMETCDFVERLAMTVPELFQPEAVPVDQPEPTAELVSV